MKTYTAVFAALLAASTSSLLAAPAMAAGGCSTVAECLGHETASAGSDRSGDDNGMGDTDRNRERNERNGNDDNGRSGHDDNGRGENDHGAGHDNGNDSDHGGGSDNDD